MNAVILCAGFGKRLGQLTKDCPKPLLHVRGKPIVEHQIESLKSIGVSNIYINLHYLGDKIKEYFGDGERWGVKIHYLYEEKPSGTAGGVKIFEKMLKGKGSFFVLYGDIISDENLGNLLDFHKKNDSMLSFYVHERENSNSIVDLSDDGIVSSFLERPSDDEKAKFKREKNCEKFLVNSAIYILDEKVLELVPSQEECDLPKDIFPLLLDKGKLFALRIKGNRVAIDSEERLLLANTIF